MCKSSRLSSDKYRTVQLSWSPVMAEIRGTFKCNQQVQVHKVESVCNRAAHHLAKLAMSSRVDSEWICQHPDF
jgi:hypothetical protein